MEAGSNARLFFFSEYVDLSAPRLQRGKYFASVEAKKNIQ